MEIKNEDLKLIALELMDLKFNREGYAITCQYIEDKLKEDGAEVEIDTTGENGKVNEVIYNYSMKGKREGIKEMSAHIIESGEARGLTGEDALGIWINHAVEFMGRRIIGDVTDEVEKVIQSRIDSLWMLYGFQEDMEAREKTLVDANKVDEMWKRTIKNVREIKYRNFVRFNKYAW